MKIILAGLLPMILCLLFAVQTIQAQSSSRDMEMKVEELQLNRSPVKTQNDLYSYYLIPYKLINNKFGYINATTGDTAIAFLYDSAGYFNEGLAPVLLNGKWGYINTYGKQIIPFRYDSTGEFSGGLCFVSNDTLMGIINKTGKEVIPIQFTELYYVDDNLVRVMKNNKYGLYNTAGVQLSPPRFDDMTNFYEERAWVKIGDKWGFINKEGVLLISPKYELADRFTEEMAWVKTDYGLYGYVNKLGEEVIYPMYEDAQSYSEGLAAVRTLMEGGISSYIYIDKKGDMIISNVGEGISWANPFQGGYAVVNKGRDKTGLIDKKGIEVIPCQYEEIGELSDSMIAVKENGKWGYYKIYYSNALNSTSSSMPISCRFDEAASFTDGVAMVSSGDAYYINKKGEYIKPARETTNGEEEDQQFRKEQFTIDYINTRGERIIMGRPGILSSLFFNGMTPVAMNKKWGFMNKQGVLAIPFRYDSVGSFNEGLATVRLNGKWGFIYQDADTLTSCRFDYAYNFHKGLAIVKMNDKYGYLDKTGRMAIPCRYDMAYTFKDSLALVRMGDQFGFINKSGEMVIPCQYDDAYDFNEGLAPVQKDGMWGYINKHRQIIIPFYYEEAAAFSEGLAAVMKDGKYGYIDIRGNTIVPFRYAAAYSFNQGRAIVMDEEEGMLMIDSKGNELFAAQFRSGFYEDLALVVNEKSKLGFINRQGQTIIPYQYDDAMIFREGLAAVAIKNKWGFINKQGIVVIPLQFDAALLFNEGLGIIANFNK
ncbi:MAG: WG repeat-containing protein [Chitinophagaceae bacterium]